jgi:twitching motility protein PilT
MTQDNDIFASGEAQDRKGESAAVSGGETSSNIADQGAPNSKKDDPNVLLARIAVHNKALSKEEGVNVLRAWTAAADEQDFEAFLIARNHLPLETVIKLVRARDKYLEDKQDTSTTPATETLQTTSETKTQDNEPDLLRHGPDVSLKDILQQVVELSASDLHVHSGAPLQVRLNGEIRNATSEVLSSEESERLIQGVLSESQRNALAEKFQIDFAYEIPGIGRFRANAYQQRRGTDAVFRIIKPRPPTLAELGLPNDLESFTKFHQGLVLFTGPAGCGKSSTMAAMINIINEQRAEHILTVEDPIEYVFGLGLSSINQREAGVHTESFAMALRAALREDPDVIVIGELRDLETISLALTAAETGHLVFGTLHTANAISTVNRLLGVFPPDQQPQVRMMLSESLKAVISQRLAVRADGSGRAVALEVMVNNMAIGNLIRDNRTFQIKSAMQSGKAQGQLLLDASLAKLLKDKVITKKEAIRHANEPESFE